MKAILWISRQEAQPMAQLLDRPFIQHVVEQLVHRGIDRIELFLRNNDQAVEDLLADGTRWGIQIACKRFRGKPTTRDFGAACSKDGEQLTILGDVCCLPALPAKAVADFDEPSIYFHDEIRVSRWTGWAVLPEDTIPDFAGQVSAGADWREAMRSVGLKLNKVFLEVPSLCSTSSKQLLEANWIALEGEHAGLYFEGVETQPGVWVAHGAKLSASAIVEAPCYVGQYAWVGDECRIGPHAVIGRQCVIEQGSDVCRSVVAEGTYLGPGLELTDSYAVRNWIHNVRLQTSIEIEEEHVASTLTAGPILPAWWKRIVPVFLGVAVILAWILVR